MLPSISEFNDDSEVERCENDDDDDDDAATAVDDGVEEGELVEMCEYTFVDVGIPSRFMSFTSWIGGSASFALR